MEQQVRMDTHGIGAGLRSRCPRVLVFCLALAWLVPAACGQTLRYSNRREVGIPEYATLRIGPFYSSVTFSQSAGYRYVRTRGTGTDYLFRNRRGVIVEDGYEFPLISELDFRNYLLITRRMDMDLSLELVYEHYPMGTQEDEFNVDLPEEGIIGSLSAAFALTPCLKGTIYDNATYRTTYIDTRGIEDEYGGEEYEHFNNVLGLILDWGMSSDKNVSLSLSREDVVPRSDEFEDQERTTYHESLTYGQTVVPGVIAGARAAFSQTSYEDPDRGDTHLQDYSVFASAGGSDEPGVRAPLSERTELTLSLGYSVGVVAEAGRERITTTNLETDVETEADKDTASLTGKIGLRTLLRKDLVHSLSYSRSLRGGFRTAFETVDTYEYKIDWTGYASSASLYSRLSMVEPSTEARNEYRDWTSGFEMSYPLVRYITLLFQSTYSVRNNTTESGAPEEELEDLQEVADQELRNDYTTWQTRIGTKFSLMREIDFTTYAEHIERYSDSEDLEYERDILAAYLTYTHEL